MREHQSGAELDPTAVRFCNLPGSSEVRVLAALALFVCCHTRALCGLVPDDCSALYKSLCSFNELQLLLVQRITRLTGARQHVSPALTFLGDLLREATSTGIGSELASALQCCLPADS